MEAVAKAARVVAAAVARAVEEMAAAAWAVEETAAAVRVGAAQVEALAVEAKAAAAMEEAVVSQVYQQASPEGMREVEAKAARASRVVGAWAGVARAAALSVAEVKGVVSTEVEQAAAAMAAVAAAVAWAVAEEMWVAVVWEEGGMGSATREAGALAVAARGAATMVVEAKAVETREEAVVSRVYQQARPEGMMEAEAMAWVARAAVVRVRK